MPIWYYERSELDKTPSKEDGIDFVTEARYRKEGARFISDAGNSLGLRYDTLATGVVYFHRFYMFHSFKTFPRYVTGAACLFLAGKVEETPKKCKDIVRAAKTLLPDHYFSTFGEDPKEEIMTFERILLQTIKFDLQVDHPYGYLLKYAKRIKGDIAKIQKLVQMAWTFINDSLGTTLSLQWEPQVLAVAVIYLAGRLSKSDVLDWQCKSTRTKWWDPFIEDVTLEMLEDICHQVLDLYTPGQEPGQLQSKMPPMSTNSPAKIKAGRPKTPPEPAPPTPPPQDEPPMKMAKLEIPAPVPSAVIQPGLPPEQPPVPHHPVQPHPSQPSPMPQETTAAIQHQQYPQASGYTTAPPSLPPVPPVPQAPPPPPAMTHDVPPQPPPSASASTYQDGAYQQTAVNTVYAASQNYPPQQQQTASTYQYSGVQAGQSQPTKTSSYGQTTTYNYPQAHTQQSQQCYNTQYQQNYTTQDYSSAYNTSYNQTSTCQAGMNYPASSQYNNTAQYQGQGQYQSNQYTTSQQSTAPSYNPPQQQSIQQQQNLTRQSLSQPNLASQSQDIGLQQHATVPQYSVNPGVGTNTYSATPNKNYKPQNYPSQSGYDNSGEQYSGAGDHGSYPGGSGHGWGPRMPHPTTPRGQLAHSTSPGASSSAITPTGLATVRITGRTDQRRSSTGRGQPFFR